MKDFNFRNDVLPLKNKLFRLALRITLNREEAEDIVQDTLLKIWDKRMELADVESIEAFSMTICRNMSLDHVEKKERQNLSFDAEFHDCADFSSTPDERLICDEGESLVESLLDRLPEKQRAIFQLRDIEGKTYHEISEIMDITESDVKVNLFRARTKLREQFTKFNKYGL